MSLQNGLRLIEALAVSEGPRGVTELAKELGLVKSNVHRLLRVLEHHGYIRRQDASGRYTLSLKPWELGVQLLHRLDVRLIARPYMEELLERTRETVHLSVLDDLEVIYIDKIESPQPVRAYSRVGGRAPATCVATGKALLAHQKGLVSEITLIGYTERSITDSKQFQEELAEIRSCGYAINRGEWRADVGGLAAPLFDASGNAIAAIGISGPLSRLDDTLLRRFAPDIVSIAANVSRGLGFRLIGD